MKPTVLIYEGPLEKINVLQNANKKYASFKRHVPTGTTASRWRGEFQNLKGFAIYDQKKHTKAKGDRILLRLPPSCDHAFAAIALAVRKLQDYFPLSRIIVSGLDHYSSILATLKIQFEPFPVPANFYRVFDLRTERDTTFFTEAKFRSVDWPYLFFQYTGLLEPTFDIDPAKDLDLSALSTGTVKDVIIGGGNADKAFDADFFDALVKKMSGAAVHTYEPDSLFNILEDVRKAKRVFIVGNPPIILAPLLMRKPVFQFTNIGFKDPFARRFAAFDHEAFRITKVNGEYVLPPELATKAPEPPPEKEEIDDDGDGERKKKKK